MRVGRRTRALIDLGLLVTFLITFITGIGLYFAPSGHIAHTENWAFLGLDKDALTLAHEYAGIAMSLLVGVHLIVEWRAFKILLGL